jgi:integrase
MLRLERGERPELRRREMRILQRSELEALIDAVVPAYRPLIATAVFTGARIGEVLGLTWSDIDFSNGVVSIRKQLARDGTRVPPKTPEAVRKIILMPALGRVLAAHRLSSSYSAETDLVFASATGRGLDRRNVSRRGLADAAHRAGLDGVDLPRLRFHDLRHTFASLLIAQGANVVFVARQLGHTSPDITLRVYAHLFDNAAHAERASSLLEHQFAHVLR